MECAGGTDRDNLRGIGSRSLTALALGFVLLAGVMGCGSVQVSATSRTGTEQLLLSSAWDLALQGVDFGPLRGVPVYLDTSQLNANLDKGWITFRIRQAMLRQGIYLVDEKEEAQAVVEAAVGTYGTDIYDWMIGIPRTNLPTGLLGLGVPVAPIPELSLAKTNRQYGTAKLALFAYDRESRQYVWESGTLVANSNLKNTYLGGLGPIQTGTIQQDLAAKHLVLPFARPSQSP